MWLQGKNELKKNLKKNLFFFKLLLLCNFFRVKLCPKGFACKKGYRTNLGESLARYMDATLSGIPQSH